MNRNAYQRKWRKGEKLLNELLDNLSSGEENNQIFNGPAEEVTTAPTGTAEELDQHFEQLPADTRFNDLQGQDDNHYSDVVSDESEGSECEGVLHLLRNDDCDDDIVIDTIDDENISKELSEWILRNKITRTASNELLSILRKHGHNELPKCTRTLLKTPRNYSIKAKCGGSYIYLGLQRGITRTLMKCFHVLKDQNIDLIVNIDGLPIFKSTGAQLWPILSHFGGNQPFTVALFFGTSKPSNAREFLEDFLNEYTLLVRDGLSFNNIEYKIKIKAFVCDAPARQFLKSIKPHNAYHGCERCDVEGEYISNRMTFHGKGKERTGESFANHAYAGTHQYQLSCLVGHGFDCIRQFPLDYMHLICLGVVKRLMLCWKEGSRPHKLSAGQLTLISNNLVQYKGLLPSEFVRQPRELKELKRWKATEFRQFLLYTGPVVLKHVLSEEKYEHFLCLSLAMRIVLDEDNEFRAEYNEYAKDLLCYFVPKCRELYADTFTVFNVHSLHHIVDDANFYNCSLDKISSFPFENHLQVFKKFIRKAQNPLSQMVRRIEEFDNFNVEMCSQKTFNTKIATSDKDSWFLLDNGNFAQVSKVHASVPEFRVISKRLNRSLFKSPCNSRVFNIVYVCQKNTFKVKKISKQRLLRKAVCLPHKNGRVLIPMLNFI